MEIKFVDDQGEWNVPISKAKNSQLLQTWERGVFQQTFGRPAYRLEVVEKDNQVFVKIKDKENPIIIKYSIKALLDFKKKEKKWSGKCMLPKGKCK